MEAFLVLDAPVPGPQGYNPIEGGQGVENVPPSQQNQIGLRKNFPETWLWNIYVIGYVS